MTNRRRPRKKIAKKRIRSGRGWVVFDWVATIIFGLLLLIGVISAIIPPRSIDTEPQKFPVPGDAIIVQVFNGSEDISAANVVTEAMRKFGVDVRSVIKKAKNIYPYSILLDRKGDKTKADSLLKITGLPKNRLVMQRNGEMFDATLVIGKDYETALAKLVKSGAEK